MEATTTEDHIGLVRMVLGGRVQVGATGPDGRIPLRIRAHDDRAIAGEIAGLAAAIEVNAPQEVREELASIASTLADLYGPPTAGTVSPVPAPQDDHG